MRSDHSRTRASTPATRTEAAVPLEAVYTNHRGETRVRKLMPAHMWYGTSPFHEGAQWFLHATDLETGEWRDFAWTGFAAPGGRWESIAAMAERRLRSVGLDVSVLPGSDGDEILVTHRPTPLGLPIGSSLRAAADRPRNVLCIPTEGIGGVVGVLSAVAARLRTNYPAESSAALRAAAGWSEESSDAE